MGPSPSPEPPAQRNSGGSISGRGNMTVSMWSMGKMPPHFRGRWRQRTSLGKQRRTCQESRRKPRRTPVTKVKLGELQERAVKKQLLWTVFRAGKIWVALDTFSRKTVAIVTLLLVVCSDFFFFFTFNNVSRRIWSEVRWKVSIGDLIYGGNNYFGKLHLKWLFTKSYLWMGGSASSGSDPYPCRGHSMVFYYEQDFLSELESVFENSFLGYHWGFWSTTKTGMCYFTMTF